MKTNKRDHGYEVKGLKTFPGMDTPGWQVTLYRDGKRIALVTDYGHGGPIDYEYFAPGEAERLAEHCKSLPLRTYSFDPSKSYQPGSDDFVAGLADEHAQNRRWKRKCRTHVVWVMTNDDGEEEIWSMKALYGPKAVQHLYDKYHNNLVEIINERYVPASDIVKPGASAQKVEK